jgi:anthranilate synthase/aminodeoxychorismate synthase-like glutamine amidotransferase
MKVIIIDNYDSFTFNLFQMLQVHTAEPILVFRNDQIGFDDLVAHKPDRVVLSPGPGHPGNDSDFGVCKDVVLKRKQLGCPVLGVCLGHQGIVHHLGGKVVRAPQIIHGKMSRIKAESESPLLAGMPENFQAMRYHSLIASDEGLPPELRVLARETGNGLIMALQHKTDPLYGVQFHPESIGTPEGSTILENFISRC